MTTNFGRILGPHIRVDIPAVACRQGDRRYLLDATLRWAAGDPHALWMILTPSRRLGLSGEPETSDEPVEWVFDVDLLRHGVHGHTGDMDVTVEPDLFIPQTIINVTVGTPGGPRATIRLPRFRVSQLVDDIARLMPAPAVDETPLYVEDILAARREPA